MGKIIVVTGRTMGRSWAIEQIAKALGHEVVRRSAPETLRGLDYGPLERRYAIFDEWDAVGPTPARAYPIDQGRPSGVAKAKRAKQKRRARRG